MSTTKINQHIANEVTKRLRSEFNTQNVSVVAMVASPRVRRYDDIDPVKVIKVGFKVYDNTRNPNKKSILFCIL